MRIIPKNTKVKMTFYKSVTIPDVIIGFVGLVLIAIALSSNLAFKALIAGGILTFFVPLYITINGDRVNGDGKMLKSAQLIKAKYNADKGAYEVIYSKVNPWPDGHSGTETLAEGEILVAISTQGAVGKDDFSGAKWIARGLKEGDLIVLNEGTIAFYPADGKLPGESDDTPATGDAGVLEDRIG